MNIARLAGTVGISSIPLWIIAGLVSAAVAQEPTARDPSAERPAGVASDSVETVDRIVAIVGDTAVLYSEIVESIVQAGAQGAEIPEIGTPEFDAAAMETLTNLVDSRILLQKAKETDIQVPPDRRVGRCEQPTPHRRTRAPEVTAGSSPGRRPAPGLTCPWNTGAPRSRSPSHPSARSAPARRGRSSCRGPLLRVRARSPLARVRSKRAGSDRPGSFRSTPGFPPE